MQHFDLELHLNSRKDDDRPEGLIKKCLDGNRKAQKAVYDRLSPKMFPLCIRYMGNREDAEDVLQEGFVTLFSKLDSYSGEGSFEGWTRRIFVNTALMRLRRNDIIKESDDIDAAYDLGSEGVTALQTMGYKELLQIIAELPPGFRTVFNMYVIEGYSHKEIAESLGITENTSRSQLQRARMILQEKIKKRL